MLFSTKGFVHTMPATIKTHDYSVKIQKGLIRRLGLEILRLCGDSESKSESEIETVLLTDENISGLYLQDIITNFQECPKPEGVKLRFCELLTDPDSSGSFHALPKLLDDIAALGLSRKCCVVALGGRRVCASAAFAASSYMGGVRLVLVPTTLGAMIDSMTCRAELSLSSGKNLACINYRPSLVLCDPECLNTLPDEEYKSGLADALGIAALRGGDMLRFFEADDLSANIDNIIEGCINFQIESMNPDLSMKFMSSCSVTTQAIERLHNYNIPHVIAAAKGVAVVARAGLKLNWFSGNTAMRILNALKRTGLPVSYRGALRAREVAREIMKINASNVKFALPSDSGGYVLREFKESEFESVISAGMAL